MEDFDYSIFDTHFNNQINEKIEEEADKALKEMTDNLCEHEFVTDNYQDVCMKCGLCSNNPDVLYKNPINIFETHNPNKDKHFMFPTIISGGRSNIKRLHIWQSSDNRRVFIGNCNRIIKDICEKFKLDKWVKYIDHQVREIYLNENVRTRGKIKTSIFLYFLYQKAIELKEPIPLLEIMEYCDISILNFNNAVDKLSTELDEIQKLYIPIHIRKYIGTFKLNNIDIDLEEFVLLYNKVISNNTVNTRPDSLAKASFYKYLVNNGYTTDDDIIKYFCKIINISNKLINKLI